MTGICIIINNRVFNVSPNDPSSKEMPERRGTEVDAGKWEYFVLVGWLF